MQVSQLFVLVFVGALAQVALSAPVPQAGEIPNEAVPLEDVSDPGRIERYTNRGLAPAEVPATQPLSRVHPDAHAQVAMIASSGGVESASPLSTATGSPGAQTGANGSVPPGSEAQATTDGQAAVANPNAPPVGPPAPEGEAEAGAGASNELSLQGQGASSSGMASSVATPSGVAPAAFSGAAPGAAPIGSSNVAPGAGSGAPIPPVSAPGAAVGAPVYGAATGGAPGAEASTGGSTQGFASGAQAPNAGAGDAAPGAAPPGAFIGSGQNGVAPGAPAGGAVAPGVAVGA